jgi:hypothetical protein
MYKDMSGLMTVSSQIEQKKEDNIILNACSYIRTYARTILTGAADGLAATGAAGATVSFFALFSFLSFLSFSLSEGGAAPYSLPLFSLYSNLRATSVSTRDLMASLSPYMVV